MKQFCETCVSDLPIINQVLTPQEILDKAAIYFKLPVEAIISRSRLGDIVAAHKMIITIIKKNTISTLREITELFGGINHTSILFHIRKTQDRQETDPNFFLTYNELHRYVFGTDAPKPRARERLKKISEKKNEVKMPVRPPAQYSNKDFVNT